MIISSLVASHCLHDILWIRIIANTAFTINRSSEFESSTKLIDWSYMDFSRVFRSSTTIHTIKEVIENYHGGNIQKLTLCKDTYTETNELRNDRITLKECLGISGSLDKNKAPVIRICYDFLPDGCTEPDPILMYWGRIFAVRIGGALENCSLCFVRPCLWLENMNDYFLQERGFQFETIYWERRWSRPHRLIRFGRLCGAVDKALSH